jgi:hypothetical protein
MKCDESEGSTNGSTGQREKAPAEPVCLITFTRFARLVFRAGRCATGWLATYRNCQ